MWYLDYTKFIQSQVQISFTVNDACYFMFDEDWEIMALNVAVKRRIFGSRLGMQSYTLFYSTLVTVSS